MANEVEIKVNADATKASKTMTNFKKNVKEVSKAVADVAMKMGVAGAAITGFGFYAAKQFADAGDAIDKMSGRTGISNRMLQVFSHAADLAGASISNVEAAVIGLGKKLPMLEKETTPAGAAFKAMGLNLAKFTAMNSEDRFMTIGDALSKMSDETARNQAAMDLLGGSGTKLANMFRTDFIKQVKSAEEALDGMGAILDDEAVASAAAYTDALDELGKAKQALIVTIGKLITPWLMTLAQKMTEVISVMTLWTNAHPEVTKAIFGVAFALGLLIPLLVAIKLAIPLVTMVLFGLSKALIVAKLAWFGMTTGIVAASLAIAPYVAAIAIAVGAIYLLVKAYKRFEEVQIVVDFLINAIIQDFEDFANSVINVVNVVNQALDLLMMKKVFGKETTEKIDNVTWSFEQLKSGSTAMSEGIKNDFTGMQNSMTDFFSVAELGAASYEQAMENVQANLNGVSTAATVMEQALAEANARMAVTFENATAEALDAKYQKALASLSPTAPSDEDSSTPPERIQKTIKQIYLEGYKKLMSSDMVADDGKKFAPNFGKEFSQFTGLDPAPFQRGEEYARRPRQPEEIKITIENNSGVDLQAFAEQTQNIQDRIEVEI